MEDFDVVSDKVRVRQLGRSAQQLACLAGACLLEAYNSKLSVDFKEPAPGRPANSNPVSSVDRKIETLLRSRLAAEFPDHDVIGEELASQAQRSPFAWIVDPLDGTTNYINGLPLFAVSIGLLCNGRPLVGAIWCATTHEFHPGVYHAVAGGELQFDGLPLSRRTAPPWRGLAAEPALLQMRDELMTLSDIVASPATQLNARRFRHPDPRFAQVTRGLNRAEFYRLAASMRIACDFFQTQIEVRSL